MSFQLFADPFTEADQSEMGSDLIQMGIAETDVTPIAAFAPLLTSGIVVGPQVRNLLVQGESY